MPRNKRIQVKIPAGVDNGSKIRVAGEGQPGIGGGPRGDLYLVISVKPDPLYERKGDDLYVDIEVELVKVMLGGEVPVPTPDGRKLILNIPAGTQKGVCSVSRAKGCHTCVPKGAATSMPVSRCCSQAIFPGKNARCSRNWLELVVSGLVLSMKEVERESRG